MARKSKNKDALDGPIKKSLPERIFYCFVKHYRATIFSIIFTGLLLGSYQIYQNVLDGVQHGITHIGTYTAAELNSILWKREPWLILCEQSPNPTHHYAKKHVFLYKREIREMLNLGIISCSDKSAFGMPISRAFGLNDYTSAFLLNVAHRPVPIEIDALTDVRKLRSFIAYNMVPVVRSFTARTDFEICAKSGPCLIISAPNGVPFSTRRNILSPILTKVRTLRVLHTESSRYELNLDNDALSFDRSEIQAICATVKEFDVTKIVYAKIFPVTDIMQENEMKRLMESCDAQRDGKLDGYSVVGKNWSLKVISKVTKRDPIPEEIKEGEDEELIDEEL